MKKILITLTLTTLLWSCKSTMVNTISQNEVQVDINLVDIKDDKVMVTVTPPKITQNEVHFSLPKIVPGTYSVDNYGKYIDNLKAFDKKGNPLTIAKTDENTWVIQNATTLNKITYLVNDTFDTEKGTEFGSGDIFSPAGSNILANKNIVLNAHCFVGYFDNLMDTPYKVNISHPVQLSGATSMIDKDTSKTNDTFISSKYSELVENPIMYSKPNSTFFKIDDMDIEIAVYSPTGKITAESITDSMKTMMTAQKRFLGNINSTKKYTVLLYLSDMAAKDAKGFGALEHPTATTVVFPELIPQEELTKQMKDVVSHEFFHIVTPLTIHSKEIQYFNYNNPKMSKHLWMYEGITEYFANLFQINQGLITEDEFYTRIQDKINRANTLDDTMPFTTMSANVLVSPYKEQYLNVYEKGTLIAMCLDIIIREKSEGKHGILDLMKKLSHEYGIEKPFNDDELFAKITELTYPEVGAFLEKYVAGPTPIPYQEYLSKVGVSEVEEQKAAPIFIKGQTPYIVVMPNTKDIIVSPYMEPNVFFTSLQLKPEDQIISINNVNYNLDNIYDLINKSDKWKENDPITIKIKRAGKEQTIIGKVKLPYEAAATLKATDNIKESLKNAWLKG
ncbi:peptidase M61 [Flavobacterium sp. 7A]|uniref:M61 family metallopeptidase n=1 Tax=Flavobacterium sp. 7A TaxID=2940571 RepID=UPI002226F3C8|nr:peptidase M61 [Flavobacterium sp. 7A]MCW2121094.1 putative metalloprotease with PDZ domain [Flavobacterium sp. 7A]